MEPKRDPLWDHISPHKILDTKEQEAQWWERQREEQMRERMQLRPRLDPGNFQGPRPWARETTPPLHRRSQMPDPDPFGLLWVAESLARSILEDPQRRARPIDSDKPEPIPCRWDEGHTPLQIAWMRMQIEDYCARRGRPILLVEWTEPPTPTPGELLAEAMTLLPALPPTAGGLCPPRKA